MSSNVLSSVSVPPYEHVVIVGVGLIGGSIARSLKSRRLARRVTGLGRNRERLLAAQQAGVIDHVATAVDQIGKFTQAVVCTPVDRIVDDVRGLLSVAPADAWVTDAGSVKAAICRELRTSTPGQAIFVGSHPMAGSERGGWEHADSHLFEGRVCAITPQGQPEDLIASIERFWSALGMRTVRLAPDQHDRTVALTSHLPHVAAAAVASLLTPDAWPLAATGFRDTTRVAGGDPALWTSILLENREALLPHLQSLVEVVHEFMTALERGDGDKIQSLLARGQAAREEWLKSLPPQ